MPQNSLAREKSPYLLQHQNNPVHWNVWNVEAFAQAREENKPIFLSIGYSTCHWCHVMERESFENEEVARYLNQHFVSIKVDREERPDVDKIYMTFVQAMTGQGGWPLNVFLSPNLKPFYGGTYWPPTGKYGRAGFLQVLQQVQQAWSTRREELAESASELHQRLSQLTPRPSPDCNIQDPGIINNAGLQLKQGYDPVNGGFGANPKFPTPSKPSFLLAYGTRYHDVEAVKMVLHTCRRMADGGIFDQLGGGFSRYSVDAVWLVPHFEKMLYDNAQLLGLYIDAWLISREQRFLTTAQDIIRYILREMTHPEGGFYSAEDADSEGKEGKFYCWTHKELSGLLTVEEFNVAVDYFGITREGNFTDHSDPDPLPNQNVLSIANPNLRHEDLSLLAAARNKMSAERATRVRPHLDDKVLASWNGLFLGALARASAVIGDSSSRAAAVRNLSMLKARLWDPTTKTLYHRWRDGERDSVQLLDAYACLLDGVVELYQATLTPDHLSFAIELADAMVARFHDGEEGGFWQSADTGDELILRLKDDYDGAEPAGNSVAIFALLKLAALTGRQDLRNVADRSLELFSDRLRRIPQAVPYMLKALDFSIEEPRRVVITGDPADPKHRALIEAAHSVYQPNRIILGNLGPVEPFAAMLKDKIPTAYVCTGTACQPPTQSPEDLAGLLK